MRPSPKGWPRISSAAFYKNPSKAIDWLCDAFGFEVRLKIEEDGQIHHSELTFGDGVVMVSDEALSSTKGRKSRSPASIDGGNTQSMFVYVDDLDAHCARARAAGAEILDEPTNHDYGDDYWLDRGYSCRDLEGHLWWFAQRLRDANK
jgi:uncharacterized glyoxalase superfamily protein PhnB